jgi:LemA protein
MGKLGLGCAAIALILIVIVGLSFAGTYNTLNRKNEAVNQQWGQVENVYQRRADLIPNLVATVQGAANFEKSTLDSVIEARSRATSIQATPELVNDPQAFQKFEQAQGQLTSALARLMVVVERYPELKATQNFRDLQAQLEGTENRITVERMRYNEVAQDFNTSYHSFPTNMIAGFFSRFKEKSYFHAQPGADTAPKVNFNFGSTTSAAPAVPATTH